MTPTDTSKETRSMLLNIGPSHPAMHGVIRLITELEGENVIKVEAEIGYLHRAFEKSCENSSWTQAIPYTDRLNYVSPSSTTSDTVQRSKNFWELKSPSAASTSG